jgi:Transcriptional regulators
METTIYRSKKPCVCIYLRRITKKVTDYYDLALKPAGVSVNQYSLLENISRIEGCSTGELAKQVRLEKSTLVRTLQPLLRDGFITDKSLGKNRRRNLYLTPSGKEVLKMAFPLWAKVQDEIVEKLGKNHDELMEIFKTIDSLG